MCAPIFNGKAPRIPFPEKKIKTHIKVPKKIVHTLKFP